ncbi:MAG TPA: GNAT family N-acetyltransferase [Bacteroidota bacterium]|jgi:L-amino acid N-acyltransferase YncA|nr:GNAT family N-acetyltransferase [Bacteroidota bacterium]
MDIYPKKMNLKDKTVVELRPLTQNDKGILINFFSSLNEEEKFYLKEDVNNPEIVDRIFRDLDYNRVFPLIALKDNEIIAYGTLYLNTFGWMKYNGEMRVSVLSKFQNKGLGTLMTADLVKEAVNHGLHYLQSLFCSDQAAAIKVFENAGFKIEAILRKYVVNINNEPRDLIIMTNDVNELWKQMEDIYYEFEYKRFE